MSVLRQILPVSHQPQALDSQRRWFTQRSDQCSTHQRSPAYYENQSNSLLLQPQSSTPPNNRCLTQLQLIAQASRISYHMAKRKTATYTGLYVRLAQ